MNTKVATGSRLLLGLIFFGFGLMGLLNLLPTPDNIPEAAMKFSMAMAETKYFFPLIKGTETLMGLLLLSGFAAPVALVVLAPVSINIFLFHAFLTPGLENLVMPVAIIVLHVLAAKGYWHLYAPLFSKAKAQ